MTKIALHWQIFIAIFFAAIAGYLAQLYPVIFGIKLQSVYGFFGTLFINALLMVIVPLIISSIISGVASMSNSSDMGRLLGKSLSFYLITSFLAICLGLFLCNIIKPGLLNGIPAAQQLNLSLDAQTSQDLASVGQTHSAELFDIFIRMIPTNIVQAASEGQMLGLIFFSMLFGFLMTRLAGDRYQVLNTFWLAIQDVMLSMTMLIMRFAPIGVFGLVAKTISETGFGIFANLAWFFLTVVLAFALHTLFTLSIILKGFKINPLLHFSTMRDVLLMAFSTSSSAATLPLTMTDLENKSQISPKITAFVAPLGATINMNGTALYEGIAVLFIAQAYGLDLSIAAQMSVLLLALFTSIGVAGVPAASLVAIAIILNSAGLPLEGIGLLMVTDRVLDMLRTAVNVYGDTVVAVIIAKTEGEQPYPQEA